MTSTSVLDLERSLVPVDLRHVPQYRFDVLVVGAGAAGSLAALAAAREGAAVAVLAKGGLEESNTQYAQGGMAAVLAPGDSTAAHVADTLRVGCGLCEREVVESVVAGGPDAVAALLGLGAEFDRRAGELALSREGGHSHARIVHARGDATGLEIQRALSVALERTAQIAAFPRMFAIDLLSEASGRVVGVLCRTQRGDLVAFGAAEVVLATGGAGQVYRETTNPSIATGDGVAMAVRAGALVRDLEFVQFHPTCLYIAGAARVLISEIVRGAGGVLRDRHGVRFMPAYHPQAELAPRDVVSRAVFERMVATDDTSVYLDLSQVEGDPHAMFPGISRTCRVFGIDIARDPVPVRPGAHYMIGGIAVDLDGRTSVPGLRATGECASTGLHGANRMGSNSLLEAVVLGGRAGADAARAARGGTAVALEVGPAHERPKPPAGLSLNIEDLTYSLRSMMWREMGVQRSSAGLEDAIAKVRFWTRAVRGLAPEDLRSWELSNMLLLAHLGALAALAREESRGVHYRTDHPETRAPFLGHSVLRPVVDRAAGVLGAVELSLEPVGDVVRTS